MKIQREAVVARALDLLDEVGIEGLTMRRLADARTLSATEWARASEAAQELLSAWCEDGWIRAQP